MYMASHFPQVLEERVQLNASQIRSVGWFTAALPPTLLIFDWGAFQFEGSRGQSRLAARSSAVVRYNHLPKYSESCS
ncbi:hypothetical protein DAPPUDRAFT_252091 [Daphnia pulex]|uniref:Uncharacterized protein n=1 Tax=Daphnia pulex TaxID=6669 RepID=E9H1X9_DAPPU|nr:hypothetical protein DAPPUDRAFT_252091 [Daphnia pulex]|eukprot:EFX74251.1 hypothetical protein DAPPUDRAFT_252091 [Daphnia pulex]